MITPGAGGSAFIIMNEGEITCILEMVEEALYPLKAHARLGPGGFGRHNVHLLAQDPGDILGISVRVGWWDLDSQVKWLLASRDLLVGRGWCHCEGPS